MTDIQKVEETLKVEEELNSGDNNLDLELHKDTSKLKGNYGLYLLEILNKNNPSDIIEGLREYRAANDEIEMKNVA